MPCQIYQKFEQFECDDDSESSQLWFSSIGNTAPRRTTASKPVIHEDALIIPIKTLLIEAQ